MTSQNKPVRVLYSFPHKLGAERICYTAWQQVDGLAAAGADVLACPGALHRPVPGNVEVWPTLARGKMRIPYRLLGRMRACEWHDYLVSRRIEKLADQVDIIHTWPLGALRTLKTAARLGIPTVLERPNAHTRFAYGIVQQECDRLGVPLPPDHEHFFNHSILQKEEEEYQEAYRILCPSDFVVKTFREQGVSAEKLVRHIYGFDEKVYHPGDPADASRRKFTMLFVGVCAVRKGLHYALEAWLQSPACNGGIFLIAGAFLPAYQEKLAGLLAHPSVKVLGHRTDVPDLMRQSDILVLPSIEEGFGLVVADAMGSGCVPLVSDACTDICRHGENGLVHRAGDVGTLAGQITMLYEERGVLNRLRSAALRDTRGFTWTAAGRKLLDVYADVIRSHQRAAASVAPRFKNEICANAL